MGMHRKNLALIFTALAFAAGVAWADKPQHGPVTDPEIVATVDAKVLRIGKLVHAVENGGVLYVAGQEGVAAIGSDGKPMWAARLPHADIRTIDVDGSGIAFVAQNLQANDPGGFEHFIEGSHADIPRYKDTVIGVLDKGRRGAVLWTTPVEGEARFSPPALAAARVAATDVWSVVIMDRITGSEIVRSRAWPKMPFDYYVDGATRNRPAIIGENVVVGVIGYLRSFDTASGVENWKKTNHGLMSPFDNISAGPILWGDRMVFASVNTTKKGGFGPATGIRGSSKSKVFVAELKDGDEIWSESLDDEDSGVGSLALGGDRLYVATNFVVDAFNTKGKRLWSLDANKENGAVMPSRVRGVRYFKESKGAAFIEGLFGAESLRMGYRSSLGFCMAADDRYLYLSSTETSSRPLSSAALLASVWQREANISGREVITVIDGESGRLVASLDAKGTIFDLLLVGPNLVAFDADTIRIFRRPG